MSRQRGSMNILMLITTMLSLLGTVKCMNQTEKRQLKEKVVEMFNHAYRNYIEHAFPADELMPLSCKGRGRGTEPSRGDIDDVLGNFSLTLIDTLDSLVVLGQLDEFEDAVRKIIDHVSFDTDVVVSVFETNIRVLGGLLGAHVMAVHVRDKELGMTWYKDELLALAHDLGTRLLPAFNTSTGIPYPRVNLLYGIKPGTSRTGHEKDTCTACAGTMILEFASLSRLTGDPIFENKAHAAMNFLWKQRHRSSDLMGTVINIHNGDWVRRESGVGAGIDSYYEYMLKAYILLGDETYLDRFNKHYDAVMRYVSHGPMMVDVHMHKPLSNSRNFMDALLAFWPGLQVLKGDLKSAIETHEMLYQVIQRHNFLPEAFTTDFRVHWGQHPLRPEFLESTYFIHKATGDPYYLEVGKLVMEKLEKHARVPCGFAAIKDVTTGTQEDQMDSYVLAETFKYLYLLFSEREDLLLDIDDYLFTTEAHLLPLSLSIYTSPSNVTNTTQENKLDASAEQFNGQEEDDGKFTRTCPNTQAFYSNNINYAHSLRMPLKNLVERVCPKPRESKFTIRRGPRLRAVDFIAGNKDQLEELRRMGIRIATMKDGRVQLLHTASEAASASGAEDGMIFMQEMIDLSKQQQQEVQQEPRVVQLLSPPYFGNMVFSAGPAQFGYDLKNLEPVHGSVMLTRPMKACQAVENPDEIRGRIAVMERGECMFIDKARHIMAAGAVGGIVIDHNEGTNSETSPLFAMSGDGRTDVTIPVLFLFHHQGQQLLSSIKDSNDNLYVMMGYKPKPAEEVIKYLRALRDKALKEQEEEAPSDDDGMTVAKLPPPSNTDTSSVSDLEAPPRDDRESETDATRLLLNKYMKKMKLGDIEVQIKENRQWNQQAESLLQIIEGPDKNKHVSVQLENLVTSETEQKIARVYDELVKLLMSHTNLHSLSDKGDYLKALSDLVETAFTQGEKGLDMHAQITLDKLAAELKPKKETDESGDGRLNEELIKAVEGEETKRLPSDTSHFYLSENDLNEEGNGRPTVVKKAPEWMNLQDGEVMVDENGVMYVTDGYDFEEDAAGGSTLDDLVQPDHSQPLSSASAAESSSHYQGSSPVEPKDSTEIASSSVSDSGDIHQTHSAVHDSEASQGGSEGTGSNPEDQDNSYKEKEGL